jgi:hypothetical protein
MSDLDGPKTLWKTSKRFRYSVYLALAIAGLIMLNQCVYHIVDVPGMQ